MSYLLTFLLAMLTYWSIYLTKQPNHAQYLNYLYNLGYGIFFFFAFITHLFNAQKSDQNRHIYYCAAFASLGYFAGLAIWTYYNLRGLEIPYPSWSDIAFLGFYFATIIGVFCTIKKMGGRTNPSRILESLILWGILFTIAYSFVKLNSQDNIIAPLATLLNLLYPLLDSFLLMLSLMIIRSQFGRLQPNLLFLVFSFLTLTLGDAVFSYQSANNYYWNGNYVDYLFAIFSYLYAMGSLALPQLLTSPSTLKLTRQISND